MRRKHLVQMAQEMDGEYGAAQLMILYQLPRFSDAGPLQPGDERETTLKRVLDHIAVWGVSQDDLAQRATDHAFWMFACEKHAENVLAWDAELSTLLGEDQRRAATASFRERLQAEFLPWFQEEQRKQG
jgi:hypothetical protein